VADSAAFELACTVLERDTPLSRLEARGTIRLTIKAAGLDSRSVTPDQMAVVAANLLSGELASRGVGDGDRVCSTLRRELDGVETSGAVETPDAVFARLGGV